MYNDVVQTHLISALADPHPYVQCTKMFNSQQSSASYAAPNRWITNELRCVRLCESVQDVMMIESYEWSVPKWWRRLWVQISEEELSFILFKWQPNSKRCSDPSQKQNAKLNDRLRNVTLPIGGTRSHKFLSWSEETQVLVRSKIILYVMIYKHETFDVDR